jgi:tRNA A37 methylthiotransferase MiaB
MQVALNADKDRLGEALADRFNLTTAQRFGDGADACGRTALTLRVQTGCEEQCSYCIIPQTRGAGCSRPLPGIVAALQRAVAAGHQGDRHYWCASRVVRARSARRVVVDGPRADLERMERRCAVPGTSLEPMDCTAQIIDLIASSDRLAPHLHLPLQHGSDEILRFMRRPYTVS